ncbi:MULTISPECIES: hypothetical protein [unclassified Sphingomonas]|uniref:hypothetical protein n=1 Tax=unclassified Sphingomonas TaxID=196159 RepID=UPI00267DEC19
MARDILCNERELQHYPTREIETMAEDDASVELGAILLPTTAQVTELDVIVAHLGRCAEIVACRVKGSIRSHRLP